MSTEKLRNDTVVSDDTILTLVKEAEGVIDADTLGGVALDSYVSYADLTAKTDELKNTHITNRWINAPIISTTDNSGTISITTSSYSSVANFNGPHTGTSWLFSSTSDFSTIKEYSVENDSANLTEFQVPEAPSVVVYVKVRYHSGIVASPWSDVLAVSLPSTHAFISPPELLSSIKANLKRPCLSFNPIPNNGTDKYDIQVVGPNINTVLTASSKENIVFVESASLASGTYTYKYRYIVSGTSLHSNYKDIEITVGDDYVRTTANNVRALDTQVARINNHLYLLYSTEYAAEPNTWASQLSVIDIRTGVTVRNTTPTDKLSNGKYAMLRSGSYIYFMCNNATSKHNYKLYVDENDDLLHITNDSLVQIADNPNNTGASISAGVYADGHILTASETNFSLYSPATDTWGTATTTIRIPAVSRMIQVAPNTLLMLQRDPYGVIPVIYTKNGETITLSTGAKLLELLADFSVTDIGGGAVAVIGGADLGSDIGTPSLLSHSKRIYTYDTYNNLWVYHNGYNIYTAKHDAIVHPNGSIMTIGGGNYTSTDATTVIPRLYNYELVF